MEENRVTQQEYVSQVLDAYRKAPGTTGVVRRPDRLVAAQLYQRNVPLRAVGNALILGLARRLYRPDGARPLGAIRSLAYFLPVIEEVLGLDISQDYFRYLYHRIKTHPRNQPGTPASE